MSAEKFDSIYKAKEAAKAFMQRRGCELLATDFRTEYGVAPLVFIDEGDLVHVTVDVTEAPFGMAPPAGVPESQRWTEMKVMDVFVEAMGLDDSLALRFDAINIHVVDNDRAILRHHKSIPVE